HVLDRHVPRGARAVLDHHLPAELARQALRSHAAEDVGEAAGRGVDDHSDRAAGVAALGERGQRGREKQRRREAPQSDSLIDSDVSLFSTFLPPPSALAIASARSMSCALFTVPRNHTTPSRVPTRMPRSPTFATPSCISIFASGGASSASSAVAILLVAVG